MIELRHISKDFGTGEHAVHAVQDVSLTVETGEIFGIIGFSGAGKSTLVRCINLLERPTSGEVLLDGQELTALPPKQLRQTRKKIGMIFQHFNLMPSRTVAGNVAYPLRGSGLSREQIAAKVQSLLELVGIGDKADAFPSQLSGGQKQRIAIVRSLMMDPEVMLFDEPTSALDPEMIGEVLDVMKALAADGMTMIVVTHEMRFAREVAARTIFLADGKIEEDKPSHELFDNPESPRLVSFLQKVL